MTITVHYQPTGRIWTRLKRAMQIARENWQIRQDEKIERSLLAQFSRADIA